MKNESHYEYPVNLYISKSYDDAETAQNFIKAVAGEQLTVSKSRNGDYLYVSLEGSNEDIDAFLDVYKDKFTDIVWDCDADANGWVKPKDVYDSIGQDGKVLPEESKVGEGRSNEDYLQEVWDSLVVAWDKDKFNMGKGYDSEYECECITITSKDNEEVRAKIYVEDYNGRHPAAFNVVYRYPGDKGVGVMGTYEFQSTDMDGLGEEVFDYFDEIKQKVGESKKSENATTEEDAIRKAFKSIVNHVPANVKSNFDEEFVTDNMEALLDLFNAWFVFEDGEFVTTVRVVDPDNENGEFYDEDDEAYQWNACYNVTEGIIDLLGWNYGEETVKQPIQDALFYNFIGTKYIDNSNESKNRKKSESLTLKQKELKDMARYGEAKKSEADEHIEFKQTEFPKELRKLYKACSERFYCEPYVSDMLESSRGGKLPKNEMTCDYTLRGSFGSDVILSVNMVYRGGAGDMTFTVTVSALDETTGRSWKRLGDATARSFDDALNAAMSEVDKNLMPFAVKVRRAIKGESKKSESLALKQKQVNESYTGIDNFIEGLTDECNAYRKADNYGDIPEEVLEQLPEGWKEHDADRTTMVAMSIKYRGYKSYLDKVDGVSNEQASQIVWDENQLFLEQLINNTNENNGINLYVFGRMGGWLGFKWSDFAAKYVTYVLKDDEATRKAIFDAVWDKYVDADDTSFTGEETLEELISKLDINNASEGAYVFDDQDWFTAVVSDDGIELMENLSKSIDDQEAYMMTQEWYDGIKDTYNLENSMEEKIGALSKKSESLTLKQKELKDMARFGQAEDITAISDAEAKELKKKGIETVGISRGVYGMNGALLRDNEGNKYVITARSSNLFYFV